MVSVNNDDRAAWLSGSSGQCEGVEPRSEFVWRLALLGAPGVGKGTQADLLRDQLGACHLSTGDLFRIAGMRPNCELSPAMQAALAYMRRGELVPDATVWDMIRERTGCLHCQGGFILDGFPRTVGQAQSLQQLMEEEKIELTAVINYELPTAEIVARLGGRRTCDGCKHVYHTTERPPENPGRCDRCGGKLSQREDDRPESIKVRLDAYDRSTAPLIAFYQRLGLLERVPANGTPDQICVRTFAALNARRAKNHPTL